MIIKVAINKSFIIFGVFFVSLSHNFNGVQTFYKKVEVFGIKLGQKFRYFLSKNIFLMFLIEL